MDESVTVDPYQPIEDFSPNPYFARRAPNGHSLRARRIGKSGEFFSHVCQDCVCGGYADTSGIPETTDVEEMLDAADRAFHDHLTSRVAWYLTTPDGRVVRA